MRKCRHKRNIPNTENRSQYGTKRNPKDSDRDCQATPCSYHAIFEVDELWTYIARKDNEYWLAYALDRATGQVIDFVLGKRSKATLKILIDDLLALSPKKIRTDRLTLSQRLIPKALHRCGAYCINHIERKNLSIRTHIKRLSRRTIYFSRSIVLLESYLKIYFWG
jgi:insertion element IS1 protein InsB